MPISFERVSFGGWDNCWRYSNGELEMIFTGDVGPRVISFGFPGGQNVFKTYESQMGGHGESDWKIRGGARVWMAPEDPVASYGLDNTPVEVEFRDGAVITTGPVDEMGLRKQIETRFEAGGVCVQFRLQNAGKLPAEFALWAFAVMAPGGVAATGLPPRGCHPQALLPANPLVMWPYTDLADPRWGFHKQYITLRQDAGATTPQKAGHYNPDTWAAYFLNGELFLKRTKPDAALRYPDFGCSFEIFTNSEMLELETLGPLRHVEPGQWLEHTETWELHRVATPDEWTVETLDAALKPLL